MTAQHHDDAGLARALAEEAGRVLLDVRAGALRDTELRAEGDRASNELLLRRLAAERPQDAVLCEEARRPGRPAQRRPGLDRRPARRHP